MQFSLSNLNKNKLSSGSDPNPILVCSKFVCKIFLTYQIMKKDLYIPAPVMIGYIRIMQVKGWYPVFIIRSIEEGSAG